MSHLRGWHQIRSITKRLTDKSEEISRSIDGGEAYRIVMDGKKVGGVILRVNGDKGDLDILFVTPKGHIMNLE